MSCIIILMTKIEDARKIGGLLNKNGFPPDLVCTSAADALSECCRMEGGVIICGGRLTDMSFVELQDCIPSTFRLIILSRNVMSEVYPDEAVKLELPLKVSELLAAIDTGSPGREKLKKEHRIERKDRTGEERKYIDRAKAVLMEKKGMAEPEAYRYLQKTSMDSGNTMVETAQMVLLLHGSCA